MKIFTIVMLCVSSLALFFSLVGDEDKGVKKTVFWGVILLIFVQLSERYLG